MHAVMRKGRSGRYKAKTDRTGRATGSRDKSEVIPRVDLDTGVISYHSQASQRTHGMDGTQDRHILIRVQTEKATECGDVIQRSVVPDEKGQQIGESGIPTIKSQIQELISKTPQQLQTEGWEDISDPRMVMYTQSRLLRHPITGLLIRFDRGKEGRLGFSALDHYHVYADEKGTNYYDKEGNIVKKGSKASHIVIGGKY